MKLKDKLIKIFEQRKYKKIFLSSKREYFSFDYDKDVFIIINNHGYFEHVRDVILLQDLISAIIKAPMINEILDEIEEMISDDMPEAIPALLHYGAVQKDKNLLEKAFKYGANVNHFNSAFHRESFKPIAELFIGGLNDFEFYDYAIKKGFLDLSIIKDSTIINKAIKNNTSTKIIIDMIKREVSLDEYIYHTACTALREDIIDYLIENNIKTPDMSAIENTQFWIDIQNGGYNSNNQKAEEVVALWEKTLKRLLMNM